MAVVAKAAKSVLGCIRSSVGQCMKKERAVAVQSGGEQAQEDLVHFCVRMAAELV